MVVRVDMEKRVVGGSALLVNWAFEGCWNATRHAKEQTNHYDILRLQLQQTDQDEERRRTLALTRTRTGRSFVMKFTP